MINLALFKYEGTDFQINVDPDLAMEFKKNADVDIIDVLKVQNIFSDAKKGNIAKSEDMINAFGTDDVLEVAKQIIQKGEVQVSSEYRNKLREQKFKEIVNLVHRNAIDPTTKLPHPPSRIENAIKESKFQMDEHKSVKDQLDDVMKAVRTIIPLKFDIKKLIITLPSQFAGKAYGQIRNIGRLLNENWNNDGSLTVRIEIPAGIELDVYDQINGMTQGQAEIKGE